MPVIILGAGGHARVLLDALKLMGVKVIGLTDAASTRDVSLQPGVSIIGGDEVVLRHSNKQVGLVNGLGSVAVSMRRKELFVKFKDHGYEFVNVIHPSVTVATEIELGEGVQIMAGVVIQTGSRIGNNSIINTHATLDHDCDIGRHVHIAPGVTLSGGVQVGDGTHIGTGATVIQGVRIGENCQIAAGAVVIKDVSDGLAVAGVPAKEMGN